MTLIAARPHAHNLVRWAEHRPEVVVFSGDLTGSVEIAEFRQAYPDRFFSLGMAEQNMLSWAGGMAREGFTPWLHTFAVFLVRRPYDQLAMSVAYPNLPVRLVGFLPGITTPGGVTHQAIEDVSLMRGLPNMTVIETGDATEVESCLDVAQAVDGPVYIRMLRGEVPRLFDEPMQLDRARLLGAGDDVAVITSGICTQPALAAADAMRAVGVSVAHLHVSTLKPFNDPAVAEACAAVRRGVITLENHNIIGGLGTAVAEVMAGRGIGVPLERLGIDDRFAFGSSRRYLMECFGLTAGAVVAAAQRLLGEQLDVQLDEAPADTAAGVIPPPQPPAAERLEAM